MAIEGAKIPPQNTEAEASLLGAVLIDPDAIVKVADTVDVRDFYDERHQRIFEAIQHLYEYHKPIDVLTLSDQLKGAGFLDMVGGSAYLTELTNFVPTAAHVEQYAEITAQKALRRRLIQASQEITGLGYDEAKDLRELIEESETKLFEISQTHVKQDITSLESILTESFDRLDELHKDKGKIRGVPTGYKDVDDKLAGFQRSDLIILAARPSMGKAQPLDANVLTASGWKLMNEIKAGDALASIDGKPSAVTGVFPQGIEQTYEVIFSDGRAAEFSGQHLWKVHYRSWEGPRILTTEKVAEMLTRKRYQKRLWIDMFSGDFGRSEPLPVAPWALGILIGEGDFQSMRVSSSSNFILDRLARELGSELKLNHAGKYDYRVVRVGGANRKGRSGVLPNPLREHLKKLGLWGKKSEHKFIPDVYKSANYTSRQALLQGLLDADGWAEKHTSVRFSTSSEQLADDVVDLARSLGAWVSKKPKQVFHTYKGGRREGRPSFVLCITHPEPEKLFSLPEKRKRAVRTARRKLPTFTSIKPLRKTKTQCIAVSHPSQQYVTDNYVVTHNTALSLNFAHNVSIKSEQPVLIFSLEMSKEQLVDRMLAMESGVDAWALRTGNLTDADFEKIGQAMGSLSEAQIYIDDTPGITVSDLRTKARREAHQHPLGLIIVDYLQLMSGGARFGGESNRVQEISEISRGLKGIARELNLPVLALSQLSRSVENRHPQIPQLADLRESGCLTGDTLVTLADSGKRVPIRDLTGKSGFRVWALNPDTLKLESSKVSKAFSTGKKHVYKMTTRLGRTIRATGNHKFYSLDGWRRLDELNTGDRLALPRRLPNSDEETLSLAEAALLGHLIGDGCTLPRHAIQYTTRELDLAEKVVELASLVFGDKVSPRIKRERTWYQVYLSSSRRLTHGVRNPVAKWLGQLEVFGLRSHEKRIPEKIFRQTTRTIGVFIKHLWATDGCIKLAENSKRHPAVYYASSSQQLARDVQSLLLRLGINATLRPQRQGSKGRTQHHVTVTGKEDLLAFAKNVGAVGQYKSTALAQCITRAETYKSNTNRDVIPATLWRNYAVPAARKNGVTSRQLQQSLGMSYMGAGLYKQNISRERTSRLATAVGGQAQDGYLSALADSDVYWDSIISIEPDREEEVFDLTVPGLSNFVANDIVVHNSIEQDADVVAFIYREDYYNPETDRKNITDILIKKHRNGPVGGVELYFDREKQRFRSLDTKHATPFDN